MKNKIINWWNKYQEDRATRKRIKNQTVFVWCKCGNEMVEDHLCLVRDVYVKICDQERNVVHFKCTKCGKESFLDFDFPVPITLPLAENDTVLEKYKLTYSL